MTRRFRTESFSTDGQLEAWLNEMAEIPEDSPHWRHHSSRQLKIESIQFDYADGMMVLLAVISRLEADHEL